MKADLIRKFNILFTPIIVLISISKVLSLIGGITSLLVGVAIAGDALNVSNDLGDVSQLPSDIINPLPVSAGADIFGKVGNLNTVDGRLPLKGGGSNEGSQQKAAAPGSLGSERAPQTKGKKRKDQAVIDSQKRGNDDKAKRGKIDKNDETHSDDASDADKVVQKSGDFDDFENYIFPTPSIDEKYDFSGSLGVIAQNEEELLKNAFCDKDDDSCFDSFVKSDSSEKSFTDQLKDAVGLTKEYDEAYKSGEKEAKKDIGKHGIDKFGGLIFPDFNYENALFPQNDKSSRKSKNKRKNKPKGEPKQTRKTKSTSKSRKANDKKESKSKRVDKTKSTKRKAKDKNVYDDEEEEE